VHPPETPNRAAPIPIPVPLTSSLPTEPPPAGVGGTRGAHPRQHQFQRRWAEAGGRPGAVAG